MVDGGPDPNDPLSPYFPSEVPDLPTDGRRSVALLLLLLTFSWLVFGLVRWTLRLFGPFELGACRVRRGGD